MTGIIAISDKVREKLNENRVASPESIELTRLMLIEFVQGKPISEIAKYIDIAAESIVELMEAKYTKEG